MSKEFIQSRFNSNQIKAASNQQLQLSYFVTSEIQDSYLTKEYLDQWAQRHYETNDYFLNFVKGVFHEDNFLKFYRFFRKPVASARLINNDVVPNLKRVFYAENSSFSYTVSGVDSMLLKQEMKCSSLNDDLFDLLVYNHNSIVVTDLFDMNTPMRVIVDIDKVISIDCNGNDIIAISYHGFIEQDGMVVNGYVYVDDQSYIFYDTDYRELINEPHDLGYCPAHFVSNSALNKSNPVVRKSLFSFIRAELEEYTFLKTLLRMTEPNGAIPITTHLEDEEDENFDNKPIQSEPSASDVIGSQRAEVHDSKMPAPTRKLQAGTVVGVPVSRKADGSIDMDVVRNYFNFFYIPTDALEYINKRISELENTIIRSLIGDKNEGNREGAKNELQVRKSVSVLQNTLRDLSVSMSRIRKLVDTDYLGLKYGISRVEEVITYFGSDFFLESENELYALFEKSPNPIERKNTLLRITKNRYKNNNEKLERQEILYNLLPFISDKDFAVGSQNLAPEWYQYQTRFNYWINRFEAEYGDIVSFFNTFETSNAVRYSMINNLILNIIKNEGSYIESVQGSEDEL